MQCLTYVLQAVHVAGQEPLTSNMLADAPPHEQKWMLGERLFPLIYNMYPDLSGKITGMLLEIDNSELLHMLESHESLKAKVRVLNGSYPSDCVTVDKYVVSVFWIKYDCYFI